MLCLSVRLSVCLYAHVVVLNAYESIHSRWLRNKALEECLDHVRADDSTTHGISIGPVRASSVCCRTSGGPVCVVGPVGSSSVCCRTSGVVQCVL